MLGMIFQTRSSIAARLRSMESIEKYAEKNLKNVSGKPQLTGDHKAPYLVPESGSNVPYFSRTQENYMITQSHNRTSHGTRILKAEAII